MRAHGLFDHRLPLRVFRRQAQLDALLARRDRALQAVMPVLHAAGIIGRCRGDQVAVRLAQAATTGRSAGGIE